MRSFHGFNVTSIKNFISTLAKQLTVIQYYNSNLFKGAFLYNWAFDQQTASLNLHHLVLYHFTSMLKSRNKGCISPWGVCQLIIFATCHWQFAMSRFYLLISKFHSGVYSLSMADKILTLLNEK